MNRKKLILAILLPVLALAIGYAFWQSPRQKTAATLKYAPGAAASKATPKVPASAGGKRLRLDLMEKETPKFSGFRRNIFKPIFPGKGELTARSAIPKSSRKGSVKPVALPPPAPYVPPKDTARFTFLGFLQKEGKKTVFLSNNSEIFLAKVGDRVAGRYELVKLTDDSLTLRSTVTGDETVIPVAESRPPVMQ